MADPVLLVPVDNSIILGGMGATFAPITFQGTSDPSAAILYFRDGTQIANSSADGTGVFGTSVNIPLGDHEVWVTANGVMSNVNSIGVGTDGYARIDSPVSGEEFETTQPSVSVALSGVSAPGGLAVAIALDRVTLPAVQADANGNWTANIDVPLGFHEILAGVAPTFELAVSTPVFISVIQEVSPPRPTLNTNGTFTYYMNWLAGTLTDANQVPPYSATRAACIVTNSPLDYTLAGALNRFAGNPPGQWLSVNTILNRQAGTDGLSDRDALYRICLNVGP